MTRCMNERGGLPAGEKKNPLFFCVKARYLCNSRKALPHCTFKLFKVSKINLGNLVGSLVGIRRRSLPVFFCHSSGGSRSKGEIQESFAGIPRKANGLERLMPSRSSQKTSFTCFSRILGEWCAMNNSPSIRVTSPCLPRPPGGANTWGFSFLFSRICSTH